MKGKGKNVLRSRLQATYNIPKCSLTPYASCELTHLLNDKGAIDKTRWTLGVEWKLSKHHGLDFYYLYQNHEMMMKQMDVMAQDIHLNFRSVL